ncbi:hypothetical protein Pan216_05800 [Planctomycetes bacterium Pan216]|uniref:Uncharacterized protein n=1 Tax=Kolteria novifilia TaxID=2527975 RepID=A0A518AYE8_9BACT|nr:hypothetical protein Pan216_05800 [Planctomycetes bacterium Pan216]
MGTAPVSIDPFGVFGPPPGLLPYWIMSLNLLHAYIVYITLMFLTSVGLRLRFYSSVLDVARHLSTSCPNVYRLINEHWILTLRGGLLPLVSIYVGLLAFSGLLNLLVLRESAITFEMMLDRKHPLGLVIELTFIGTMIAVDLFVSIRVSQIDTEEVKRSLNFAERWLGSRLNRLLQVLGRWNPIKQYADTEARAYLEWLNDVFHMSLTTMITQVALRLVVAISLVTFYLWVQFIS